MPAEWTAFSSQRIYRLWKAFSLSRVYDFDLHVLIGEHLALKGKLPPDFMQLPVHSTHPDVWTDVAQMRSLNTIQSAQGAEKHLCPLPFDIVKRLITQFSMPGEIVLDPFAGLMTVPYVAMQLGRQGVGIELNDTYFADGVVHCTAMSNRMAMPSLFDLLGLRGGEDDGDDFPGEREGEAA
jgi:DNA modification methylase